MQYLLLPANQPAVRRYMTTLLVSRGGKAPLAVVRQGLRKEFGKDNDLLRICEDAERRRLKLPDIAYPIEENSVSSVH